MKIPFNMERVFSVVKDLLFPSYCLVCGKFLIGENNYGVACKSCWQEEVKPFKGEKCVICGHPLKLLPGSGKVCKRCLEKDREFWFDGVEFYSLNQGLLEYALRELKFERNILVAKSIGKTIERKVKSLILKHKLDAVTFIPVSKERLKERGYDQCEEILKQTKIPFKKLLTKVHHTERQSKLPFIKRRENIKGVFKVKKEVQGKKILLFDDIFTTGETVNEASKLLKEAGAEKVLVFTVAYTPLV